jgi:hypothetical protein
VSWDNQCVKEAIEDCNLPCGCSNQPTLADALTEAFLKPDNFSSFEAMFDPNLTFIDNATSTRRGIFENPNDERITYQLRAALRAFCYPEELEEEVSPVYIRNLYTSIENGLDDQVLQQLGLLRAYSSGPEESYRVPMQLYEQALQNLRNNEQTLGDVALVPMAAEITCGSFAVVVGTIGRWREPVQGPGPYEPGYELYRENLEMAQISSPFGIYGAVNWAQASRVYRASSQFLYRQCRYNYWMGRICNVIIRDIGRVTQPLRWVNSASVNAPYYDLGSYQSPSDCHDACLQHSGTYPDSKACSYQCNGCYLGASVKPVSDDDQCFQQAIDLRGSLVCVSGEEWEAQPNYAGSESQQENACTNNNYGANWAWAGPNNPGLCGGCWCCKFKVDPCYIDGFFGLIARGECIPTDTVRTDNQCTLHVDCLDESGAFVASSLVATNCEERVNNCNGVLTCGNC